MRITSLLLLLVFSVVALGCNTIEGVARGAKDGIKKDWEAGKNADSWVKENMW